MKVNESYIVQKLQQSIKKESGTIFSNRQVVQLVEKGFLYCELCDLMLRSMRFLATFGD